MRDRIYLILVSISLALPAAWFYTGCATNNPQDIHGGVAVEVRIAEPPPALDPKPVETETVEMVPLQIELPPPMFKGTPIPIMSKGNTGTLRSRTPGSPTATGAPSASRDTTLGRMMTNPDEVWIVEKYTSARNQGQPAEMRADLLVKDPETDILIPVPLQHTDVEAHISMFVARVDVTQQYANPFEAKIEATYVFPLPQNAAVTDFLMKIGDRLIRGLIREKEEAKRMYNEARRQGYTASLLTQERPNIFTQKVANIEPGKRIDIQLTYFNTLKQEQGEYEFVFPMVVGPRFNPPDYKNGIGAMARGKGPKSIHEVAVEYLAPNERTGHDISLKVHLDGGVKVEELSSPTHAINKTSADNAYTIALRENDQIPNRDFVLRYRLAGEKTKSAAMVHRGDRENTFALLLEPPASTKNIERQAREMIFVVDCSGSMRGRPLAKVKEAMRRCLRNLDARDTFQIIRFSSNASQLGLKPLVANQKNVRKGLKYIDSLNGSGGTMMIEGIKAALDMPHEGERLRVVSFMTDGFIGNEADILMAINERLGRARIFSFGVGNSVNRYLLESMARVGKGAAAYVGLDEGSGRAVDRFYEHVAYPAMTDIEIDWGALKVTDVYPKIIPDLFPGKPVMVTGRFSGGGNPHVVVRARTGSKTEAFRLALNTEDASAQHEGIQFVWARQRIRELHLANSLSPANELKDELVRFSTEYNVLCKYTAFLAIDTSRKTEGEHGYSVHVPVPVPDGVLYETTVK